MELELLWNGVLTAITLLLGWVFTLMQKRLDDMDVRHSHDVDHALANMGKVSEAQAAAHLRMQEAVTNIQVHYVHKDDMRDMRKELNERFDRLETLVKRNIE
jgi:hypothetical protein